MIKEFIQAARESKPEPAPVQEKVPEAPPKPVVEERKQLIKTKGSKEFTVKPGKKIVLENYFFNPNPYPVQVKSA